MSWAHLARSRSPLRECHAWLRSPWSQYWASCAGVWAQLLLCECFSYRYAAIFQASRSLSSALRPPHPSLDSHLLIYPPGYDFSAQASIRGFWRGLSLLRLCYLRRNVRWTAGAAWWTSLPHWRSPCVAMATESNACSHDVDFLGFASSLDYLNWYFLVVNAFGAGVG